MWGKKHSHTRIKNVHEQILHICIYTVIVRIIGTLGKYEQRSLWK